MKSPPLFTALLEALEQLPGIGKKSAERIGFYLLNNREVGENLSQALRTALDNLGHCRICGNITEGEVCKICSSPSRDKTVICVVETPMDIYAIEKTGIYNGLYHVLGALISPLDGKGPEDINIDGLLKRIEGVKEIILAIKPSTEGDATSMYLAEILKKKGVSVSRLARGLPVGSELELTDPLTIINAIKNRSRL
ncbi:recombination protein RecR [candidate division WOR-3 bacterium]|nr:recombination protein RecR [candidate division WOR-3 bacterium]